jgi:hypothetical protein
MKMTITSSALCAALLMFAACANPPKSNASSDEKFQQNTRRHYNPETSEWEQSPPYGKQSNKSDQDQQ